jgi:hypothetical protein
MTITYNYLANSSTNMLIRQWTNSTISHNYFKGNWSSPANHGQQISPGVNCTDIVLSNNTFKDSYTFAVGLHSSNNYRWLVYNNLIIGGTMSGCFANADSSTVDVMKQWQVHHNTFVNTTCGGKGAVFVGNLTNPTTDVSYAYNNLFYNSTNLGMDNLPGTYTSGAIIHGYSAYYNASGFFDSSEGGTAQVSTVDPLIDSGHGNARVKAHTAAGKSLVSPFTIDADGNTRTYWDRGAYEYNPNVPGLVTGVTKAN